MRAGAVSVLVIGGLLALATGDRAGAGGGEVEVRLFQFTPGRLDVARGVEVTWTNRDEIRHTVTSGAPGQPDGRFTAALDGRGTTARVRFGEPGVYPYFCDRHQAMRGAIHVP
jgi:plastocyanin